MNKELEKYFEPNKEATYTAKDGSIRLVAAEDEKRKERAKKQYELYEKFPIQISTIISYVNAFLNEVSNKADKPKLESIVIDGGFQTVLDRSIIITNCKWAAPIWNDAKKCYTSWDEKYNIIKEQFDLRYASDIIWLKFTEDGCLGVVADSFDINFNYDNSSGKLIRVNDNTIKWNESCVVVFPITKDLLEIKSRKELETGIGNYLIDKGVPIIDFYSHNNF